MPSSKYNTMFISVETNHPHYQYVIELNNLGVDLMEAKAYRSATRALREAIQIMKMVVKPDPSNPTTHTAPLQLDQSVLFEGRQRLLEARATPTNPEAMHHLGTPVRIELSTIQVPDGQNPDMASSVILYNFGLVNRWACSEQPCYQLQEGALRLFKMAYSILTDRQQAVLNSDPEELSEIRIFLLLIVLNVLSQIEAELGKHSEASSHIEQLVRLGQIAMFKTNNDVFSSMLAAPAA